MEVYEALEKFINRTEDIDVCQRTMSHIIGVGEEKIQILIVGEKSKKSKQYTEREDGVMTLGDTGSLDTVSSGEIYVEFRGVEIFNSSNPEIINNIAQMVKDRYEAIKTININRFIGLVDEESRIKIPRVEIIPPDDQLSRL